MSDARLALRPPGAIDPAAAGAPMTRRLPASAPAWALLLAVLVAYPLLVPSFWAYQIGAQVLILGTIALSLSFLAGYGGIVSLAQMTVAGLAGYLACIFGTTSVEQISLGWPWWVAVPLAVAIATLAAVGIGALANRTEGIRTIMITLAIGVAFSYLA